MPKLKKSAQSNLGKPGTPPPPSGQCPDLRCFFYVCAPLVRTSPYEMWGPEVWGAHFPLIITRITMSMVMSMYCPFWYWTVDVVTGQSSKGPSGQTSIGVCWVNSQAKVEQVSSNNKTIKLPPPPPPNNKLLQNYLGKPRPSLPSGQCQDLVCFFYVCSLREPQILFTNLWSL